MHIAVLCNYVEACIFILKQGGKIDVVDAEGTTPLLHAVILQNGAVASVLVDRGADASIQDRGGNGPHDFGLVDILRRHRAREVANNVRTFEKMQEEARVEAEALLDGLQAAMAADGDLLSADETAALQSDMQSLETVIAANQPDDIREATEILGKASEVFAARRMDRSIQKALQGVSLSELESDVAEESTP